MRDASVVDRFRDVLGDLGTVVPVVSAAADAPADALVDPAGALARRYGVGEHGFALIRPDGYLACTSRILYGRALFAELADGPSAGCRPEWRDDTAPEQVSAPR
jgi:hypothetical protein